MTSPPRLRLLAAVLVALQLAAPVPALLADPAPRVMAHLDHLGAPDQTSCQAFKDDLFCLSCRVLLTAFLHASRAADLTAPGGHDVAEAGDHARALPDDPSTLSLNARAPPRT